uniref:Galactosyl transferase GMA12/MNN10 family protein n=1 Tax=Pithovirus LCPAC302 TaxID=2506593 RepID=A0A481Z657_9VIRU|nr:MAG: galactosyl transferase GMA12/MNN10 family protein [Pithovirus LCPAC302]
MVSGDNRESDDIALLKQINQEYCNRNGYDFKFYDQSNMSRGMDQYCPYWRKVKYVHDFMCNNKLYEYLMWIDSDACFHDHDFRIENFFSAKDIIFVMSRDNSKYTGEFNAGVWAIKNNKKGRRFIKKWLSLYNPNKWYKRRKFNDQLEWVCKDFIFPCIWAGKYYEQGAGYNLMHTSEFSPYIMQLPWNALQHDNIPSKYSYTMHFAGDAKMNIKTYYRSFY